MVHKETVWKQGQCSVCHQPIMADGHPTDQYDQIQVALSNNTRMDVGLCKSCKADGIDEADFFKLMQSTVEGWEEGLAKDTQMTEKQKIAYRMAFYGVRILGITKQ
ncbi:MAG TPA: hypothetical protein P5110_07485 [Candidatus Omnitrophota bacterium]|nr:hypothetical protein [Candidatus Omnitrophota bacterium]